MYTYTNIYIYIYIYGAVPKSLVKVCAMGGMRQPMRRIYIYIYIYTVLVWTRA